jgi:hypothetical protein
MDTGDPSLVSKGFQVRTVQIRICRTLPLIITHEITNQLISFLLNHHLHRWAPFLLVIPIFLLEIRRNTPLGFQVKILSRMRASNPKWRSRTNHQKLLWKSRRSKINFVRYVSYIFFSLNVIHYFRSQKANLAMPEVKNLSQESKKSDDPNIINITKRFAESRKNVSETYVVDVILVSIISLHCV